jgi:hypothetical protein
VQTFHHQDNSIAKKVLYFGASLRGTTQYWSQRGKELRALIQYQINEKQGLPLYQYADTPKAGDMTFLK